MGPNGPCGGRAGCAGQKSGRKWLFLAVRFGTLWQHGVASRAAREDELEPRGVGLPCVCLPVDTCLRGSSDRRFDPHSSPMCTHSGLASECQLVETSARRIVELSHCRSVNVSKGLRACVLPCVLRSLHCGLQGGLYQLSGRNLKPRKKLIPPTLFSAAQGSCRGPWWICCGLAGEGEEEAWGTEADRLPAIPWPCRAIF